MKKEDKKTVYVFNLKASRHKSPPRDVELALDTLINCPYLTLPNKELSWKLGLFAKELRDKGLLHISSDLKTGEPIAILKVNNFIRPNIVSKKSNGKYPSYVFEDTFIPKFKIPSVDDII